jgi:hypothetical protein
LLAWAAYLDSRGVTVSPYLPAVPDHPATGARSPADTLNLFWAARAAGKLRTLENDKRRTISFSLCWPARSVCGLSLLGAVAVACYGLATDPGQFLHPFGWLSLLLLLGLAGAPPAITFLFVVLEEAFPAYPRYLKFDDKGDHETSGNALIALYRNAPAWPEWLGFTAIICIAPLSFGAAAVVLAHQAVETEVILA